MRLRIRLLYLLRLDDDGIRWLTQYSQMCMKMGGRFVCWILELSPAHKIASRSSGLRRYPYHSPPSIWIPFPFRPAGCVRTTDSRRYAGNWGRERT